MKNIYRIIPTETLNSVRWRSVKDTPIKHPALDACEHNVIGEALGIVRFMDCDFNKEFLTIGTNYETIISFEVVEHLQNPLFYLTNIYKALVPGGRLYLTTPVKWIFKGKYHFHEFTEAEIVFCLKEAGFENLLVERIAAYDLRNFGIRPVIRKIRDMIFGQCFYITAIKKY